MKSFCLLLLLAGSIAVPGVEAASFVNVPIPNLQPGDATTPHALAWGDYDNDGDLDFFQTAAGLAQLWRNEGTGFAAVDIPGLPTAGLGFAAWVDADNDGRLDLLHSGLYYDASEGTTQIVTHLWRNTGAGFVRQQDTGLPTLFESDVACADFDLDGRKDLLLVGCSTLNAFPSEYLAGVWRNVGGRFTRVPISGLPQVRGGSVSAADYDGDGRPDFVIMGVVDNPDNSSTLFTQLWRNTPSGFVLVETPGLTLLRSGQVAWADFDQNGRPDLLLSGLGPDESGIPGNLTRIWLNTPSGFNRLNIAGFPGDLGRAVAILDYDNNGWPDFLVAGAPGISPAKTQLWRNQSGNFAQASLTRVPGLNVGCLTAADYDNDKRVDFLLAGFGGAGINLNYYAELWRNTETVLNAPPTAPPGLVAEPGNATTTLRWQAATDDHSPSVSLTYNVRIGTQPGGVDVVSPESDPQTGFRRVPAPGNAGLRTQTSLKLSPGIYFASVQAVDVNNAGGPFSPEIAFVVRPELRITRQSGGSILEWERLDSSWTLESGASLPAAVWFPETSGTNGSFLVPFAPGQRFYRLYKSTPGD